MKVSAYVRQIAINGAVTPKLNEEERLLSGNLLECLITSTS